MTAPAATGPSVAAAAGGPAALRTVALSFTYPGARDPALDTVDLEVPEGALLALVGPSGCGKSTFLRVVAGLLAPTGGRLLLDGVDAAGTRSERREVGWVPQGYGLFDHLDVRGNVGFGLRARRTSRRESADRVAEVLRLCRIDDLATQRVDELSGGQRQRVAIARALAVRPRVLLLDEPLAALDPELRTALRADLAALLRRSGVTTLLVTHDQGEALALADAVAVLRAGRLVQHGSPTELWEAPAEPFVATFVGGARVVSARCTAPGRVVLAPGLAGRPSRAVTGAAVPIAVRPDDLVEDPDGVPFGVESVEYRGGRWRAVGALAGGPSVVVDLARPPHVGEQVLVAVRPDARLTVVGR